MDMVTLSQIIALLVSLSVAAERLVEILKNALPSTWLSAENPDPRKEEWRKFALQVLAVGAGILTAFLAKEALPIIDGTGFKGAHTEPGNILILGLLASGGAGFWTSVLTYTSKVKEIRKIEAAAARVRMAAEVDSTARSISLRTAADGAITGKKVRQQGSTTITDAHANLLEAIQIANATL